MWKNLVSLFMVIVLVCAMSISIFAQEEYVVELEELKIVGESSNSVGNSWDNHVFVNGYELQKGKPITVTFLKDWKISLCEQDKYPDKEIATGTLSETFSKTLRVVETQKSVNGNIFYKDNWADWYCKISVTKYSETSSANSEISQDLPTTLPKTGEEDLTYLIFIGSILVGIGGTLCLKIKFSRN